MRAVKNRVTVYTLTEYQYVLSQQKTKEALLVGS